MPGWVREHPSLRLRRRARPRRMVVCPMRGEAQGGGEDFEAYKRWKPDAQAKALAKLREAENNQWRPFYCKNRGCNGQPHVWPDDNRDCPNPFGHVWDMEVYEKKQVWICEECKVTGLTIDEWVFPHARVDQRPPNWRGNWRVLALRGGRGSGKTRTGAEITNRASEITPRIILIGSTGPDLRATMVEGESGILATAAPNKKPIWEPSKKQLTWPNGCVGLGFSAEEPDRLRGPQSGFAWGDEPAHWPLVQQAWDNLLYGLRLKNKGGLGTRAVVTSTPKPIPWMKELVKHPRTVDRVVSTYANIRNLDADFRTDITERFEGTRQGRQELHGEILEDVEGALWNLGMIQHIEEAPTNLRRIVVSVDPAGTANKRSDETGIIVVALGPDGKSIYVLHDSTDKYSPNGWAQQAHADHDHFSADCIVAEKNYGGDMVRNTLENAGRGEARIKLVTSRRGKELRAEPIVALYEKGRVFHVGPRGALMKLEDEMTSWVPGVGSSPNRVDALVHGITEVAAAAMPVSFVNPRDLLRRRGLGGAA